MVSPIERMIDQACGVTGKSKLVGKWPAPWRLGKETKGGNVWVHDARNGVVTLEKKELAIRIIAAINSAG